MFAGQRDDPFFVDLGATFDAINIEGRRRQQGKAVKDDLAGYGVHSIVLQVPEEQVTRDGDEVDSRQRQERRRRRVGLDRAQARVGAGLERAATTMTTTTRPRQRRRLGAGLPAREPARERGHHPGRGRRTSSTAPLRTDDAELYGKFVVKPELAAILNALFGVEAPETEPRRTSSRRCCRASRA